jgi:very-short-patch-repair endonuclease
MVTNHRVAKRQASAVNRSRAKTMRHAPVGTEKQFWPHIRNRKLGGFKFKRQHLIGPHIVDYVCLEEKPIVELDGTSHQARLAHDAARNRYLQDQDYRVLRFENGEVVEYLSTILEAILTALTAPST